MLVTAVLTLAAATERLARWILWSLLEKLSSGVQYLEPPTIGWARPPGKRSADSWRCIDIGAGVGGARAIAAWRVAASVVMFLPLGAGC